MPAHAGDPARCGFSARALFTPELLAEQRLDVEFVIDHKNQNAHV
jgi:hypothetical protein